MTTANFKKAIQKDVKGYLYASPVLRMLHIDEFTASGKVSGNISAAIISIQEDEQAVHRYRVYYNFSESMGSNIGRMNFYSYSEAYDELKNFAN